MNSGTLPILTYHAIDSSGAVTATCPSRFADTLDALLEANFRVIDLGRWIEAGRPRVEQGFALAFDDGLRSILGVADRLARLQVPATVFLIAERIGLNNAWPGQPSNIPHARLLGRSDIESLSRLGFRFASHGSTHQKLTTLKVHDLKKELISSRDKIEHLTGTPCRLLAYPYGASNTRVRLATSRIYEAAFGTRLAYASRADDLHEIARIDAYYLRSASAVGRLIAGRWRGRLAVRRAFRAVRQTVSRVGMF